MKSRSWNKIRNELGEEGPESSPRDADAFWSDFRAHARLHPQQAPMRPSWGTLPRWAITAACALALIGWASIRLSTQPHATALSTINSVEVVASYGGVVIMDDDASQSTILWIVDMDGDVDEDTA